MIRNYIIIAWRNLKKNKLISFINVFGLTISISVCLLIALFVYEEINYDKFEKDYEQVYRLEQHVVNGDGELKRWAATPAPLASMIQLKFTEAIGAVRLMPSPYTVINVDDKKFKEENCFLTDSNVFDVLGLSLLSGNKYQALRDPSSVVISESMSLKLFGAINTIGKTIEVNSNPFKISGILKDIPQNSHLQISMLRSILISKNEPFFDNWRMNTLYSYVRLRKGVNPNIFSDNLGAEFVKMGMSRKKEDFIHKLHSISQIHLDGNIEKELSPNSSWTFVYVFITIAVLVLILASINYINLTTSRSLERSREIGLRKSLGAFRSNLITQFLTESVLTTILSYIIALLLVYLSLPIFNSMTSKHLSMLTIINPFFAFTSLGLIIFIGFLAGIYPAFVISSFDPVNTLKGVVNSNIQSRFSFVLRKSLVVFQFAISAFLVIASLTVIKQISFMFNKPLGFDKENVMILPAFRLDNTSLNVMKSNLKNDAAILNISATSAVPGKRVILGGVVFPGANDQNTIRTMFVDHNYLKTMNVSIVKGRDFDQGILSDTITSIIINETAVKNFRLKDVIGQNAFLIFMNQEKPATIIGVAKDFHQGSLHNTIEPTMFVIEPIYYSLIIRFKGDIENVKTKVATAWRKTFPDELFTYSLMDDDLNKLYKTEKTLKDLLIIFTGIAILIASLGLFGVIYFSNTLRKKEIGVRKVLGAANTNIVLLLSKEYIFLIALSLIISVPLSNYTLHKWLNNFAYRTDISFLTYFMGTFITLVIALVTLFFQGMRSALNNPIKNLRSE